MRWLKGLGTRLKTRAKWDLNHSSFFTKDKQFYKTLFSMLAMISLQNLVAFSVNMADNIMLGSYSQNALSGAATVNQIFFVVQQTALAIGSALVTISAQYWGQERSDPIRALTAIALKIAAVIGMVFVLICLILPGSLLRIFTPEEAIIMEGKDYLRIILFVLRHPLLSLYADSFHESALVMADHLLIIMSVVMVGMSYQMPVISGIIQGGGDAVWCMKVNLISVWLVVVQLSIMATFWWKLPVEWVVLCVQSDQIFKGLPAFLHFRKYKWAKILTR